VPDNVLLALAERAACGFKRPRVDDLGAADAAAGAGASAASAGSACSTGAGTAVDGPAAHAHQFMSLLRQSGTYTAILGSAVSEHQRLVNTAHALLPLLATPPPPAGSSSSSSLNRGAEACLVQVEGFAARAAAAVNLAATSPPTLRPPESLERNIYCPMRNVNVPQTWQQKIDYIENGVEVMAALAGGGQQLVRRPPLRLWSDAAAVNWVRARPHFLSLLLDVFALWPSI
jgi:hypothetical protein